MPAEACFVSEYVTMSDNTSEQIVARSEPDEETVARANALKEAGNALFAGIHATYDLRCN